MLAYLTRPEGLILPVALLATLVLLSLFLFRRDASNKTVVGHRHARGGTDSRGGPVHDHEGRYQYQAVDPADPGPRAAAPAMAVERERPLDPDQTTTKTTLSGGPCHDTGGRRGDEPAAPLARAPGYRGKLGHRPLRRRYWLLLGTIIGLSALAMIRLHAMSGYCTPRHAMVVAWILIPASAAGLNRLAGALARAIEQTDV